jgi:hypothetical protein
MDVRRDCFRFALSFRNRREGAPPTGIPHMEFALAPNLCNLWGILLFFLWAVQSVGIWPQDAPPTIKSNRRRTIAAGARLLQGVLGFECVFNTLDALLQVFHAGCIGKTQMSGGSECCSGDQGNTGILKHPCGQFHIVPDIR